MILKFERSAGILLHPTSLPGNFGIGDLGINAYKFVDFLAEAGQTLWQVFPLGPTSYGDSPYQCLSAFAGNPLLISPEKLIAENLLSESEIKHINDSYPARIDYGKAISFKKEVLTASYQKFKNNFESFEKEFNSFIKEQYHWLDDYSLFMAAKDFHNGASWNNWDNNLVRREQPALKHWTEKLHDEIRYHKFVQFLFFKQWKELKKYANKKGIKIIGDMPIFIAYDSADLWANKELFTVDEQGKLTFVAGVPPDYFSATGQLWGNPLYKWDVMEKDEFLWWRKRFKNLLELVDIVRIDHFRGFEAYWQIPGDEKTAEKGEWIKAPGVKLFNTLKKYFGELPILAEDLGVITPEVEALRDKFGFPGMKVLQFAFGKEMERKFLPHNFIQNCVVYTGTHDNDTTKSYFEKEKEKNSDIFDHAQKYLNYFDGDIVSELIRTAYASVAVFVIIPMQDILNLGMDARMNFPSKTGGNWSWRFTWEQVDGNLAKHYFGLCRMYERPPKLKKENNVEVKTPGS